MILTLAIRRTDGTLENVTFGDVRNYAAHCIDLDAPDERPLPQVEEETFVPEYWMDRVKDACRLMGLSNAVALYRRYTGASMEDAITVCRRIKRLQQETEDD